VETELSEFEKLKIRSEEIYRKEVSTILNAKEDSSSRKSLWLFLNSTFGIWFLSTCIIGSISFFYSQQQNKAQAKITMTADSLESARKNALSITVLLPYLASENPKQSLIAIAVTKYLKDKGELPVELEMALEGIVQSSLSLTNSAQKEVINAAAKVLDSPSDSSKTRIDYSVALPPRVYIQISREDQRALAESLQQELRNNSFLVPGIEDVNGKAFLPTQTEVRYFREDEKAQAVQIIDLMKKVISSVSAEPKMVTLKNHSRPKHFEVWFSK
jgi:hypothetical protein